MEPTLLDSESVAGLSDHSSPQTPSPRTSVSLDDLSPPPSHFPVPEHIKSVVEFDPPSIFADNYHNPYSDAMPDEPVIHTVESPAIWTGNQNSPYFASQRGSLLQELYNGEDQMSDHGREMYPDHPHPSSLSGPEWANGHHPQLHQLHPIEDQHSLHRRATFPSVRHDRDDLIHHGPMPSFFADHPDTMMNPYASRQDTLYGEPLSMGSDHGSPQPPFSAEPSALHSMGHLNQPPQLEEAYVLRPNSAEGIKLEDAAPVIVPSQHVFYPRPATNGGMSPMPMYMTPHAAIPIQHTDDAASKETQYLRRRCFNCHTTEPPSWRRSTLNPGKIVCNKCGLYERTHLRPRPHRFDELRAGNKARKNSQMKVLGESQSPKPAPVKKEPGEYEFDVSSRRGSVSGSSVHSSGCSDYDDSVSISSSSGSAVQSYNNSPLMSSFSIPSPPTEAGGIRLPNAPLSDIASFQQQQQQSQPLSQQPSPQIQQSSVPNSPRKAVTSPFYNTNGLPISRPETPNESFSQRRGSAPAPGEPARRQNGALVMPEITGWQPVPISDLDQKQSPGRSRSVTRKMMTTA